MKKVLLIVMCLILFGCNKETPTTKVKSYLNSYINLDEKVLSDLNNKIDNEDLSKSNENLYKDILINQYENMSYSIIEERIDGLDAYVTVKINVNNLYKAYSIASSDIINNSNEYYDQNNNYLKDKADNHILNEMNQISDRIDYEITIFLTKMDSVWIVKNPDTSTIEKINGLYNYNI